MVTYEGLCYQCRLQVLTNNTEFDPLTISELYRERWQVELFFKWIKQHLRIKSFYGTSQKLYSVRYGLHCACSLFLLSQKAMEKDQTLYSFSQICGITPFEKVPLNELFSRSSAIVQLMYS